MFLFFSFNQLTNTATEVAGFNIQGVTEKQVQNWTMPIQTKNKTFYKNDKNRLTAYFLK